MGLAAADYKQVFKVALPLVALSGVIIASLVWSRRHHPAGRSFFVVVCSGLFWSIADWLSIVWPKDAWLSLAIVAVHTASIAWLVFCMEYTGRRTWITTNRIAAICLVPWVCSVAEATNDFHHLFWAKAGSGYDFGPFWWISTIYDYVVVIVGIVQLLSSLAESGRAQRRRTLLILDAILFPLFADLLQFVRFYPPNAPNPATLAFAVSSLAIFVGLFLYDLLEVTVAVREIVERMNDALILVDAKDCVVQLNRAAVILFDVDGEHVESWSLTRLVKNWPEFSLSIANSEKMRFEIPRRANGQDRYFEVESTDLKDKHGWRAGRFLLVRDVSEETVQTLERTQLVRELQQANEDLARAAAERKRAVLRLQTNESSWREFCEGTVMGIYRTTPSGHISTANAALIKMLGYDSLEDLAQVNLEGPAFPANYDRKGFKAKMQRDGEVIAAESEWRRKDGTLVWVRENAHVSCGPDGSILFYEGTVENITQRKRAEEERRRMEQQILQAQKTESLGLLVGGIAHDFNNLLAAILANIELAQDDIRDGVKPTDQFREIRSISLRAAELSRQMLAYVGKGPMESGPVDLGMLTESMLDLLRVSVSAKASLEYSSGGPARTIGDATQIRQIILNLVINAGDAMTSRRGTIRISTGTMNCTDEFLQATTSETRMNPGIYSYLKVEDDGIGMDQTTLQRIFEPFFTTKVSGRGWGLSAVLGIVRAHSGALGVESQPGQGTRFCVVFPLAPQGENGMAPSPQRIDPVPTTRCLLLVDDDESLRRVSAKLLRALGYTVFIAESGRRAVDIFTERQAEIHLVLLDLTMPDMDGEETFRLLRQLDPAIKVLFTSGYSHADITRPLKFSGANGFVQKPYTRESLTTALAQVLSQ